MNAIFILGALACGVILTSQVAVNKQLGEHLHNLYIPAVVNMVIGVVATVVLTVALSREYPSAATIRSAPWYGWLGGGVLGAAYLTATILLAPRLGAATLIGLVVTGQIVFSVMADHFGWFGFEQHTANLGRLFGCLFLAIGVAFVTRY